MTGKGQHTPGPWENSGMTLGRAEKARRWEIVGGPERRLVAEVPHYRDARLIAAAPALLGALRALYEVVMDRNLAAPLDEYGVVDIDRLTVADRVFTQARAAIRLVEGK